MRANIVSTVLTASHTWHIFGFIVAPGCYCSRASKYFCEFLIARTTLLSSLLRPNLSSRQQSQPLDSTPLLIDLEMPAPIHHRHARIIYSPIVSRACVRVRHPISSKVSDPHPDAAVNLYLAGEPDEELHRRVAGR